MDAGVHPSLHASCHVQIVYACFNLKNHYSHPMKEVYFHFGKPDINFIRKTINEFDRERAFFNLDINEIASFTTIKNIMRNFIPHQTIICDDKNPLWIRGYHKNNNI